MAVRRGSRRGEDADLGNDGAGSPPASGVSRQTGHMTGLTLFGAAAVTIMMVSYALEQRSHRWVLLFAFACAGASTYGWLAGTWPFGVVEGVWALVALRRWYTRWRDMSE